MRTLTLTLGALLLAGCTAGGGAVPGDGTPSGPAALVTATTAPTPSPSPTPRPTSAPRTSPTPVVSSTYTPDDTQLAAVIREGVAEAIPELDRLTDMDPSDQVALFEPLGAWITRKTEEVTALTPSSCTADAVTHFLDGLDQYDEIRELFLAWKDWGAHGRAYAYGAPGQIATTLRDATTALKARCPV